MWGLILFGLWCSSSAQTSVEPEKPSVTIQICCDDASCPVDPDVLKELLAVRHGVEEVSVRVEPKFELTFGRPECESDLLVLENSNLNRTFDIFKNGHLWVYGLLDVYVPVLDPSQFCVEQNNETQITARACYTNQCKDKLCVHKCCQLGFTLDLFEGCIEDSNQTFALPLQYYTEEKEARGPTLVPTFNAAYLPRCNLETSETFGVYEEKELQFYFLADGGIYLPNDQIQNTFKSYCVDKLLQAGSVVAQVGAIVCTTNFAMPTTAKVVISHVVLPILMQISAMFLLLTFVVYVILPELQTLHGKTVMCHVGSMWVHFVLIGVINFSPIGTHHGIINECIIVAVITHFAFMSAFGWLGVMGFDICWTFRHPDESDLFWHDVIFGKLFSFVKETEEISVESCSVGSSRNRGQDKKKFLVYSLVAWGTAFLIAGVGITADMIESNSPGSLPDWFIRPGFGTWSCWFHTSGGMWAYLYGPLTVMLTSNMVMFALTAPKIYEASKNVARLSPGDAALAKERLHAIAKLFLLMGLTWITEAISFAVGGEAYYWIVSDVINICMPIFIFFLFVCKKKVFEMLATRYSCCRRIFGRVVYRHPAFTSTATTSINLKQTARSKGDESARILTET